MSFMLEVYYRAPVDRKKEAVISEQVGRFGGRLTFREEPSSDVALTVCLTYEFDELSTAVGAASSLRTSGEHVEGPADYGD